MDAAGVWKRTYGTVSDIVALLPEFNPPAGKSLDSHQFVKRVNFLSNSCRWDDRKLIFAVHQKILRAARYWVDSTDQIFLPGYYPADVHLKMSKTNRDSTESPSYYFYNVLALGKKGELQDSAICTHTINGINDYDLKRKISNFSCNELLRDILAYSVHNIIKHNVIGYKTSFQR